jgi:Fe-S-cluster containining protein
VDAAVAEAARKSGPWLVCRIGCTQCCIGPFPITQLDARRLRLGLRELEARDAGRAGRIRERAREYVAHTAADFPGDPASGVLAEGDEAEARFEGFASEEPCPALDPETGACELYSARPITCRTFGPPVRFDSESLAVCELCFEGAGEEEIAACEVDIDPGGLESAVLDELEDATGLAGQTIVAYAVLTAACG